MWRYTKNIIQLIFSPDHGWDDIAVSSSPSRAYRLMTALLIVAALSPLIQLIYHPDADSLLIWQSVVIIFAAFWSTFFIGEFILGLFLPHISEDEISNGQIRSFTAYITGLLSLKVIIESILPISFAILQLWPIYVVIIIWRGMRFFHLPEQATGKFLLVSIPSLIFPSQIILWVFYNSFAQ